jgi:hypothetical protein
MKALPLILLLTAISCSKSVIEPSCIPTTPSLVGNWELIEIKFYGGCCPNIPDTGWKKIDATLKTSLAIDSRQIEVTNSSVTTSTTYQVHDKEIIVGQNIFGGPSFSKSLTIVQMTGSELVLKRLAGKEGEVEEQKYKRICP